MPNKLRFIRLLGAIALSGAFLAACGGDDSTARPSGPTCGEGTQLVDKKCIVDESGCGAGTVFDEDAQTCVAAVSCGEGTSADANGTCVPNSDISCGAGTEDNDGVCVPAAAVCGPGTELNADNRCVLVAAACPTGTQLDANTGACALSDTLCEAPLAFTNGQCLTTDEVCDDGTYFVEETGRCLPSATCRLGDVVLEGICASPAELLAADPGAVTLADGTYALGTPPEIDETFIFKGVIGEPKEEDGQLTQDEGSFSFEGAPGQWFSLSVQSLGLPSPFFFIEGPEDYFRASTIGVDSDPARYIVLPYAGEYTVTILPLTALFANGQGVGPFGDNDWNYVGALERIAAPTPTEITVTDDAETSEALSGNIKMLTENYFTLTGADANDLIALTLETFGNSAFGEILYWTDETTLLDVAAGIGEGDRLKLAMPDTALHVVVDWVEINGPNSQYHILTEISGFITPVTADSNSTASYDGTGAPERSIIQVSFTGTDAELGLAAFDANGTALGEAVNTEEGESMFAYYHAGGDYRIDVINPTGTAISVDLAIEFITPESLGSLPAGETASSDVFTIGTLGHQFFILDSTAAGDLLELSQLNQRTQFEGTVLISLFDQDGNRVTTDYPITNADETVQTAQGQLPNSYIDYNQDGGALVVHITNIWEHPVENMTLTAASTTPIDLPGDGSLGYVTDDTLDYTGPALDDGENHWLRVTFAEDLEINGFLSSDSGDVDLIVYTTDFDLVFFAANDGDEEVTGQFIEAGTYLFQINAWEAAPSFNLDLFFGVTAPRLVASGNNLTMETADEISDFEALLIGTAEDGAAGTQSYWHFTIPDGEPQALIFEGTKTGGGFGWVAMWIYDSNGAVVETSNIGSASPKFVGGVFQPGETYFLRLGGNSDVWNDPYDYSVAILDVSDLGTLEGTQGETTDLGTLTNDGLAAVGTVVEMEVDTFSFTVEGEDPADVFFFRERLDRLAAPVVTFEVRNSLDEVVIAATNDDDAETLEPGDYTIHITNANPTGVGNSYVLSIAL